MKQTLPLYLAITALLLGTALYSGCGGPGIGLDAVAMPEADLVGQFDPQAMRGAPFWNAVADLAERQSTGVGESTLDQVAFFRQILERTELTADDLLEVRLAARMTGERLDVVTGFLLASPLTPQATDAVLESLAEQYSRPVAIQDLDHPAGTVLRVETETGEKMPAVFIGFARGNTVLFQGGEEAVQGAMDRIGSGKASVPSLEMVRLTATVGTDAQAWLAYTVSEDNRDTMMRMFGAENVPAPLQGLLDSLGTFTSAAAEIHAGEDLDVRLNWYFQGTDNAETFQTSLNGLTELLKGLVALASGGRSIDAVDSMTLTRSDQSVQLGLTVSQNDLLTLEELYELNLTE